MTDNNLSNDILKNPHYLDLKDSGRVKKRKTLALLPSVLIIILSIIPLFILYSISVGFIIGGFNYVFTSLFYIKDINLKVFLYNLMIGSIGSVLIFFTMYLTSFLVRLIKR